MAPTQGKFFAKLSKDANFALADKVSNRVIYVHLWQWSDKSPPFVTAKDGTTTAFDEAGPQITEAEWTGFELHFSNLLHDASMVVIAGSLPPGTPDRPQRARWTGR